MVVEYGVDGLLIGNYGGRSFDILILLIMIFFEFCKWCLEIFECIDIFMDGGICCGIDMFKVFCLGVKVVGMGRYFMYVVSYGEEGVLYLIDCKWFYDFL